MALSGPDTQPRNQAILAFLENELGTEALRRRRSRPRGAAFRSRRSIRIPTRRRRTSISATCGSSQGDLKGAEAAWDGLIARSPDRAYLAFDRLERLYEQHGHAAAIRGALPAADRRQPAGLARAPGARPPPRRRASRHAEAFEFLLAALEQNPHGLTVHQAMWNVLLKLDLNRALVQRYIESARSSVFFLDPHVCLKCHYRSTDLLWQCPHCHEWNSFVEERIAPAKEATVEM